MFFSIQTFKHRTARAAAWAKAPGAGLRWVLLAGSAAALAGCVVAPVDSYDGYSYSSATVYSSQGNPPPPRREVRPHAPGAGYVWLDGAWLWQSNAYHWRPGYWSPPGHHHLRPPAPPHGHVRPPHVSPPHVRPPQLHPLPPRTGGMHPRPPHARPDMRPDQRPGHGRPEGMRPERPRPPHMDGGPGQRPDMRPHQRPDQRPHMRPDQRPDRPAQARPEGRPERPQMRPDAGPGARPDGRPSPAPRPPRAERHMRGQPPQD